MLYMYCQRAIWEFSFMQSSACKHMYSFQSISASLGSSLPTCWTSQSGTLSQTLQGCAVSYRHA